MSGVPESHNNPQRRYAALVVEWFVASPDPRAVATGLLSLLEALAEAGPILLAVDELQWLDHSTAFALAFAARIATIQRARRRGRGRAPWPGRGGGRSLGDEAAESGP